MEKVNSFIPREIRLVFKELLKSMVSDYYKDLIASGKEPCAFGIYTDSDMTHFVMAANTQEFFKKSKRLDDDQWWIPEWENDSMRDQKLYHEDARYKQLETMMDELKEKTIWDIEDDKNTFAVYKRECFDCMCDALTELKEEGLFTNTSKDFFLLVQESDNGIYEYRQKSLNKIMSKDQLEAYLKTF